MTNYAIFKALPAQERDELGFAKWRENQHIGTHGPGCWKNGRNHYECARAEIEALQSRVQELGQIARENRSVKVVGLESEVERLRTNAARYEWLRGQFWHKSNLFVVQGDKSNVMLGTRCPSKSSLDAAIDAAMADKGGTA